jgi:hypothetical protein
MPTKRIFVLITVLLLESRLSLKAQGYPHMEMKCDSLQKIISLGEPIVIEFGAKNNASVAMTLDLGLNREGALWFEIGAPDGAVAQVSAPPLLGGPDTVVRVPIVSLESGGTYKQRVWLSEWYAFSMPGTYVVTGHLQGEHSELSLGEAFTW